MSLNDRLGTDSATNLLVAMNFSDLGIYRSDSRFDFGPGEEFDPTITTGPTVLLPVAILISLSMEPVVASRVVMAVYWVALSVSIYLFGRRHSPELYAVSLALVPFAISLTGRSDYAELQGPADFVGEIPATFFVILAAFLLRGSPVLSGLTFGLAILTKISFLILLPVFLVFTAINRLTDTRIELRRPLEFSLGLSSPLVLWELFKLFSLGGQGYLENMKNFLQHFRGASVHTGIGPPASFDGGLLVATELDKMSPVPSLAILAIGVAILIFLFWKLPVTNLGANLRELSLIPVEILLVLFSGGSILLWWIFLNDAHYSRTAVPGLVLFTFGGLLVCAKLPHLRFVSRRRKLFASLVVFLVTGFSTIGVALKAPIETISDQQSVVSAIESFGSDTFSYSQENRIIVNDILVLSGGKATREVGEYAHVVSHPSEWNYTPIEIQKLVAENCSEVLLVTIRHTVCSGISSDKSENPISKEFEDSN